MGNLNAIFAALVLQWKETAKSLANLGYIFGFVPNVAVMAWVALRSNNPDVISYMLVSVPLVGIWNGVVLRVGWSLEEEMWARTMEFNLVSRTPLMLILLGKSLAQMLYSLPTGVFSLVTMFIVIRQMPSVYDIPSLVVSLILIIISLIIISLLMAPIAVLAGGRGGFFNAINALGVLVSGFLYPVARLPAALAAFARLIPSSWAMDGVWKSVSGYDSYWSILGDWGVCILACAVWLFIIHLLFQGVERRIRIAGTLSTN
jgi:ABC-type multidrug transport system permease subunit